MGKNQRNEEKKIHEYFRVDLKIVWETTVLHLPNLIPIISKILDQMDRELFDKIKSGEL